MFVSFKNMSNQIIKYTVNPNDKIYDIVQYLYNDNKTNVDTHTIKFIHKGKIIDVQTKFGNLNDNSTNDDLTIIYIINKINKKIPQTSLTILQQNKKIKYISDDLSSVDNLRCAVVGVLTFIHANPQLSDLFNNNFNILLDVMVSEEIKPLFEKLLCDNEDDIVDDDEYLDDLTVKISNIEK
jgi:hypothetical protein